ncbi:MAG: hypothetical protein M0Z56_11280 [Desulfobacteraceae bacterium]|nr:hypothetical protein [Desulfobacteraceae bacterium]
MKKTNVVGMVSLLGGISMWGWHALSDFMGSSRKLSSYGGMNAIDAHSQTRLVDIMDQANFDWIDSLPWHWMQDGANYVVTMPLWLLLVIIGLSLLIIGGLFIKK